MNRFCVPNGIYWRLRTGSLWADIPKRYGPYTTSYNRFGRWARVGVNDTRGRPLALKLTTGQAHDANFLALVKLAATRIWLRVYQSVSWTEFSTKIRGRRGLLSPDLLHAPSQPATPLPMRIIRDYQFVRPQDRGATVAIGNFDGVHLGHQAVIEIAAKADPDAPLGVMTFEPHPRQYFAPDAPPFRLMNAEAKANRLQKLGVKRLYELQFNSGLSSLTAEEFARDVIARGLGLSHVVVGADFCFGKGRTGTAQSLQEFGATHGFGVSVAELVSSGDIQISSTNIRDALSEGRPRDAARMLGHWHRIDGEVISGEQRGRELGYPTANMSLDGLHPPKFGVYAVLVNVLTGPHKGSYHGATSIGVRPMFGENVANVETYLFDFKGDLYGEHLSVGLVDYLRGEEKFDGLDALITQMDADCVQARDILSGL